MNDERQQFSQRLSDAMRKAGYEPRPGVLHKVFNSKYDGTSVSEMTASRWLSGKAIPVQDKLRVLAAIVGVDPHVLQYGGKARVGEGRVAWESLGAQERAMLDAFLNLPAAKRKLVRELVLMLVEK